MKGVDYCLALQSGRYKGGGNRAGAEQRVTSATYMSERDFSDTSGPDTSRRVVQPDASFNPKTSYNPKTSCDPDTSDDLDT